VNSRAVVPNLNAGLLGGVPASGFVQGGGTAKAARATPGTGGGSSLIFEPDVALLAICDGIDNAAVQIASPQPGSTAIWWNKDGVGGPVDLTNIYNNQPFLAPQTQAPYVVTLQVSSPTRIVTVVLTQAGDPAHGRCVFTAQMLATNG
jgi:hypothetical protein